MTNRLGLLFRRRLGFVLHNEKLSATVSTLHRGKQDRASWPMVYSLLLAVRALGLMPIETKINVRHGCIPGGGLVPSVYNSPKFRLPLGWEHVGTLSNRRMCAGARKLRRIALPGFDLPLHNPVAFAGRFFQLRPVDNLCFSSAVRDQPRFF